MDYAEEQAGEIEALKSIYEGDLEGSFSFKNILDPKNVSNKIVKKKLSNIKVYQMNICFCCFAFSLLIFTAYKIEVLRSKFWFGIND